jgi:hypothetical protein
VVFLMTRSPEGVLWRGPLEGALGGGPRKVHLGVSTSWGSGVSRRLPLERVQWTGSLGEGHLAEPVVSPGWSPVEEVPWMDPLVGSSGEGTSRWSFAGLPVGSLAEDTLEAVFWGFPL